MASELRSAAGETVEFEVGPVERDDPAKLIASSANGVITTTENHGYSVDDVVRVDDHVWNPINGIWTVLSVDSPTSFTLAGVGVTSAAGGETGTVTRLTPIDLTLSNTVITFAAKETYQTVGAFVTKTAALNSPSTARKNLATVTIEPEDTGALELSTDFYYDVWLTEPDGRQTRVDRGIWKVGAAVAA